jgi:signal transduction histidine kinase
MRSELPSWRTAAAVVEVEWPGLFAWLWTSLPLLTAVGILLQRNALASPGRETFFVGIAVFPWVIALASLLPPRRAYSITIESTLLWKVARRVIFPGLVIGGTFGLLLQPVDIDIGPFPLVFMVSEMAAIAPVADGIFWAFAAMGLMAGIDIWGPYDQSYPWFIAIALAWGGGMMVRTLMHLLERLRTAQEDLAARAATDERRRIARELHDVIAHSLTVMMLHVTGARRALSRDTGDAATALEEAERLGRQSLQDVRRVVGVLGSDAAGEPAPMPGAPDVTALVDQFRGAGATIAADIRGELRELEPTAGLALYRIVQECLTNAAKHAPGMPVDVSIEVRSDRTLVRVINVLPDAAAPRTVTRSNGLGLWGMKERAALLGGSVSAGADDRSWIVEAIVPSAKATT